MLFGVPKFPNPPQESCLTYDQAKLLLSELSLFVTLVFSSLVAQEREERMEEVPSLNTSKAWGNSQALYSCTCSTTSSFLLPGLLDSSIPMLLLHLHAMEKLPCQFRIGLKRHGYLYNPIY